MINRTIKGMMGGGSKQKKDWHLLAPTKAVGVVWFVPGTGRIGRAPTAVFFDSNNRRYMMAEDGSLRRIEKENREEKRERARLQRRAFQEPFGV